MKREEKRLQASACRAFPVLLVELAPYALGIMDAERLRQFAVTLEASYAPEELAALGCTPCTVKIELRATVTREEEKDA